MFAVLSNVYLLYIYCLAALWCE